MDSALSKLADLLLSGSGKTFGGRTFGGRQFGGNTFGGNTFGASAQPQSVTINPTLPQLPDYEAPGSTANKYMPPVQPQAPQQASMPAPQAPPMQPPPAPMPQPMPGDTEVPPMGPPTQIGVAPGMLRMPQNQADLDQWRKLMDSLQFGRQGA